MSANAGRPRRPERRRFKHLLAPDVYWVHGMAPESIAIATSFATRSLGDREAVWRARWAILVSLNCEGERHDYRRQIRGRSLQATGRSEAHGRHQGRGARRRAAAPPAKIRT